MGPALSRALARAEAPRHPLYAQIEAQLRAAIAQGLYPVGSLLPTEIELCENLHVSRHTIREALRRLVEAGLVERRPGAGTMVVALESPDDTPHSLRSIRSLFQHAADARLEFHEGRMMPLDPEDAASIPAPPGESWLYLRGLRIGQDEAALGTAELFIHPRFAALAHALPQPGTIHAVIESRFGEKVAEVVQEISAALMPRGIADLLGRKTQEVAMRFVRRYLSSEGETLLLSRSWHPAEHFTYAMRLRRAEP